MNRKSLLTLVVLLFCTACTTPYKRYSNSIFQSYVRQGYSDYRIDDNTFCVSFRANQYTKSLLFQYVLRRAAEVTLNNGGVYFVVLNQKQDTQVESYYSDGSTTVYTYPDVTMHIRIYKDNPPSNAYFAEDLIFKQIKA